MALDKEFEQLKLAALEVKAMLIDIDENIRPSAAEMEKLRKLVSNLYEHITIYTYLKNQNELTPNFNLHIKVMEKTAERMEVKESVKEILNVQETNQPDVTAESKTNTAAKKLELNLNDKFRMINELFAGSSTEFNLAVEQLNLIADAEASLSYINELKNLYSWKENDEMVQRLYLLNKKRFS